MKMSKLNLIIDALLLLCFAAIMGIGLSIKYVLIPGYQRWEIYDQNVGLYLWGLDRHRWGTIHFIIGMVFLGLLSLHVILHWSMIMGIYRKLIPNRIDRGTTALILICITALLFLFPYLVKPEVVKEQGHARGHGLRPSKTPIQKTGLVKQTVSNSESKVCPSCKLKESSTPTLTL